MPPKERRKGKKEIHKNNNETLMFYWKFIFVGTGVQITHILLSFFLASTFSWFNYLFLALGIGVQLACYKALEKMATPFLGPNGELLEAGMDLEETYFSEYAIDFIILTTGVQILSAVSNYMWLLWLLGPVYLTYKGWTAFVWPWITAGPPGADGDEASKKKQRQRQRVTRIR